MRKSFLILSIILVLSGCTSQNIVPTATPSPNETSYPSYSYLDSLDPHGYNELNSKYIGNEINWIVKNQDTDKELDISKITGVKIIELYSGFCDVCVNQAAFVDQFIQANEGVTYISISKEKSSVETQKLRENGFNQELYYFPGEIPVEAARLWDLGRPGYIIIDENNKIMFLTGGNLNKNTYKTVFNPIADLLEEPLEEVSDNGNSTEFCEFCQ